MSCLAFRDVVFVCVKNDVCKDGVCGVYIYWLLNIREIILSACSELYSVCFLVASEYLSVLL